MPDTVLETPAAIAAQGASAADLDPTTEGTGNPAPTAPSNEPPAVEPTAEEVAAREASDAAAAAAAEAASAAENVPLDVNVWGTTGSEVGDGVLTLLQNAGMTPDDAKSLLFDAVQAGDITKVDKAALTAKVGAAKAALVLAGAENFISKSKEANAGIIAEVHTTAGGEANWKAVSTWAKANVAEADLGEYRELIDAGGAKARFAVSELVGKFNADAKNTTLSTAAAALVPDGKAASGGKGTTRAEYVSALASAHRTGATEQQIAIIQANRERGRAQGL